jgi:hypothetical protein
MKDIKNTGKIVRSNKTGKSRYTPISNDIIQSKTLSIEERGVLIYLLSLPENWAIYKKYIWKDINIGRDKFNKVWKSLVEYGYITTEKVFDGNTNLITGYNHIVYEEPVILTIGNTDIQEHREPEPIQSKNSQKKELKKKEKEITNKELLGKSLPVDKFKEILDK